MKIEQFDLNSKQSPEASAVCGLLYQTTCREILARLDVVALKAHQVAVFGFNTALEEHLLLMRYPAAKILSFNFEPPLPIDLETIPLSDNSLDLVVANLFLPWCVHIESILNEWCRILRPEGLLIFSAFGADTLKEIQNEVKLVPKRVDMHDVGDTLIQIGLGDPILDVDRFTLKYRDQNKLIYELSMMHMISASEQFQLQKLTLPKSLSYEIIFAHTWKVQPKRIKEGTYTIPLDELRKQILPT